MKTDRNGYGPTLIPWEGCFVCGRQDKRLQRHEVFHGPYRTKSKFYGCWAGVCPDCHTKIHRDPGLDRKLKADFQREAMRANGWSMEEWRAVFGKNYLETPPPPAEAPPLSGEAEEVGV